MAAVEPVGTWSEREGVVPSWFESPDVARYAAPTPAARRASDGAGSERDGPSPHGHRRNRQNLGDVGLGTRGRIHREDLQEGGERKQVVLGRAVAGEAGHLGAALGVEQDAGGAERAVRHALRMRIRERRLDVGRHAASLGVGERARLEPLLERASREILEHGVLFASLLALVEDPHDVGMSERDAADLAGRQPDEDLAPELGVERAPARTADPLDQLVAPRDRAPIHPRGA